MLLIVVFIYPSFQVLLGLPETINHFASAQEKSQKWEGRDSFALCANGEKKEAPSAERRLVAEVPSSQEFSMGVQYEGFTSTQALSPPEAVSSGEFSENGQNEEPAGKSTSDQFETLSSLEFPRDIEEEGVTSSQTDLHSVEIVSSQNFSSELKEKGLIDSLALNSIENLTPQRMLENNDDIKSARAYEEDRISESDDNIFDAELLKDMGLDKFEATLANISDEDLETTFEEIASQEVTNRVDGIIKSLEGNYSAETKSTVIEALLVENTLPEGLTLEEMEKEVEEEKEVKEEKEVEEELPLGKILPSEECFAREELLKDGRSTDMDDTLADICSKDMNVLEQIVTNQSIFEEICNDNSNAYEEERHRVAHEEETWRKSDHVFDFDLEEAKMEPVQTMQLYTSIRRTDANFQRRAKPGFPITPETTIGQRQQTGRDTFEEDTLRRIPHPLLSEGAEKYASSQDCSLLDGNEEEDPDITFNFSAHSEAFLRVDPEITFNFQIPPTIHESNFTEEKNDSSTETKLDCKRRFTAKEDEVILIYMEKMAKEEGDFSDDYTENKTSRRRSRTQRTDEVFKRIIMEVDNKLLSGRSWQSLRQRWNSVLRWRAAVGQREKERQDGIKTRLQRRERIDVDFL